MRSLIQNLLQPLGYRLQNMRKIGRDPWRDLQILLESVPTPVCFDVGAHRGETTRNIIEKFPKAIIYAFEPDPDNFAVLQAASGEFPQAKLYSLAMGDRQMQTKLQRTALSMSSSILSPSHALKSEAHKIISEVEVAVTTVDQFCMDQRIEGIDLLKTDCQGFDLRVLQGARTMLSERRIKIIQCECLCTLEYEGQSWLHEILRFLADTGYVPASFGEPARNEQHEVMWSDVIFKRREASPA
jgi:FkbM family methyltransferase